MLLTVVVVLLVGNLSGVSHCKTLVSGESLHTGVSREPVHSESQPIIRTGGCTGLNF